MEDKAEFLVSFQLATVITGHMQTVSFSVTSRFCRTGCSLHFKVPPVKIPAEKQLLEHTLPNVNLQQTRQSNYGPTIWTLAVCSRPRLTGWRSGGTRGSLKGRSLNSCGCLKRLNCYLQVSTQLFIIHKCLPAFLGVQFPLRLNPTFFKLRREFLNHQTTEC